MVYLIIGHRGVGKTSWLNKLKHVFTDSCKTQYKKLYFIDLDQEIEKKTGQKINNLLSYKNPGKGTANDRFRSIERNILNKLINQYKNTKNLVFIAVGAGAQHIFQQKIPSFCHTIHLIRETDSQGRIFLDRPRLIPNQTPHEEYMSLYRERERFYKKIKTESFVLPEGDMTFNKGEKLLFKPKGFYLASLADPSNFHDQNKPKEFCLASLAGFFNFIITLNKNTLPAYKKQWPNFIIKRLSWGRCFFELRDDQLNPNDLSFLLKIIPKEKQLLSFRISKKSIFFKKDLSSLTWDWPLEKGPPPPALLPASLTGKRGSCPIPPLILSLHTRGKKESLPQVLKKMTSYKAGHFKLAVPIRNFKELMQGHLWFLKDPENRSFLPVSERKKEGQWRWYRQIFGPQMKLHFIRESDGEILDQPFLYEHLYRIGQYKNLAARRKENKSFRPEGYTFFLPFAAVLGDPVTHSASPAFHRKFFSKKEMIFTKITIDEKEFTKENLCILQRMGLICAAVTSPLKKKAFQICDEVDSSAKQVKSVNTLVFKNNKWFGSSTDQYGLQALLNSIKKRKFFKELSLRKQGLNQISIVVWGGGGLKKVLEKTFPNASFYSARTGQKIRPNGSIPMVCKNSEFKSLAANRKEPKNYGKIRPNGSKKIPKKNQEDKQPDIIIWAVGRNRMPEGVLPPSSWKTKWIIDLNYTENSPGKEYALLKGTKYISGMTMFKHQAKKQQKIFSKYLKSKN